MSTSWSFLKSKISKTRDVYYSLLKILERTYPVDMIYLGAIWFFNKSLFYGSAIVRVRIRIKNHEICLETIISV